MTTDEGIEHQSLIESVEKDEHGRPIVLSHYGFKIMEVNAKKYVVAMTVSDLAERMAAASNRLKADVIAEIEQAQAAGKWCLTADAVDNCYVQGGCTSCYKKYFGGAHWTCLCNDA